MDEGRGPYVRGRKDGRESPEDQRLRKHAAVQTGRVDRAEYEAEWKDRPEVVAVVAHRLGDELADRALGRRQGDWTKLRHAREGIFDL